MENLNNSRVWSLPFSTISTNSEGLPGVLGNKGTLAKYRREQGNISQFLGTGEQNSKNYSTKTFWESVGTWEHRAILEGNKGTRNPLGDPQLWGKIFKFRGCFSFFLSSSNIQTRIIFRVVLPKPQCVELLRQKQTRWRQNCRFCIWLHGFCSLLGVCLSAPFIYIAYSLFINSTSGNRKNAKLLKDKQFELRKVTGAVVAYSSPVNKQVEISLFCTRHLIGWIWKCWNLLFQFCSVIGLHCLSGSGFSSRSVSP